MDKPLMEQRIVSAGIALSRDRMERGGQPIRAEDLMRMKVKTFSLATQVMYATIGVGIVGIGIWMYFQTGIMVMAMVAVLLGIANVAYGVNGRPKPVAELGPDIDMTKLSSEIVGAFVKEMDARPGVKE